MIIDTDKIPQGISLEALRAIVYCDGNERRTIRDLSKHLGRKKNSITYLIDGFAKDGLLERVYDTEDRRQIFMQPTEKALNIIQEVTYIQKP